MPSEFDFSHRVSEHMARIDEAIAAARIHATEVQPAQPFIERFDAASFLDNVRTIKVVVVSQTPAPGEEVPAGASVSVMIAFNDFIPIDVFAIDDVLTSQYTNVGDVLSAVAENTAVETAITRDVAFDELSAPERKSVEDFVKPLFDGQPSPADIARVYDDVKFLYKM